MIILKAVCAILVLCVTDLSLTFARYIDDVSTDRRGGVKDELSVGNDLLAQEDIFDTQRHLCPNCTNEGTIDEIIASSSPDVPQNDMMADDPEQVIRIDLDMLLTTEQYNVLYGKQTTYDSSSSSSSERKKRKAVSLQYRWTNKWIPYRIEPHIFSYQDVAQIMQAIKEWETYTCITFKPVSSFDSNFISFSDGKGCGSFLGMQGNKQSVELSARCRSKKIIVHELGHAIGFVHEQARSDRDNYIIIKKENIIPDDYHNFEKYDKSEVSSYGVPYDYTSVMHYGGKYFSKNGRKTIVTKNPAFQDIIGNSKGLSFKDIKLANLMYTCSESCTSSVDCPAEGFVGKDCQCWCPGDPVKTCDGD